MIDSAMARHRRVNDVCVYVFFCLTTTPTRYNRCWRAIAFRCWHRFVCANVLTANPLQRRCGDCGPASAHRCCASVEAHHQNRFIFEHWTSSLSVLVPRRAPCCREAPCRFGNRSTRRWCGHGSLHRLRWDFALIRG